MACIEPGSPCGVSAIDMRAARPPSSDATGTATARTAKSSPTKSASAIVTSAALNPGEAPIDAERVSLIRKAVESGTYPVLPAQISDAMIAAGLLLRSAQT